MSPRQAGTTGWGRDPFWLWPALSQHVGTGPEACGLSKGG